VWVREVACSLDPRTYGSLLYQDLPDQDLIPNDYFFVGLPCSGELHPCHCHVISYFGLKAGSKPQVKYLAGNPTVVLMLPLYYYRTLLSFFLNRGIDTHPRSGKGHACLSKSCFFSFLDSVARGIVKLFKLKRLTFPC
jgi:hypothetical protein